MPCRRATSTSWEMIPEYFVLIASWSAVSLASTSLWVAAAVSAVAAAGTLITSNAPAGRMLMGSPAVRMDQNVEIYKAQRRLPRILAQFAELQKTVKNLVEKGAGGES